MSGVEAQQIIDVLENIGYVIMGVNYPGGTHLDITEITEAKQMDGAVSFEVMSAAKYEANGFKYNKQK